jgi:uncharacterized membrane protein
MLRNAFFKKPHAQKDGFSFRGHEVQRIETFSDAVFAFAVTLLIVSLEVPRTFEELLISMRGFMAFGICFSLLMFIWYEQHIFFRRYALDDSLTLILNCALMFIVLFYVYPLKFLFTLIFSDGIYGRGKGPFSITDAQMPELMIIYGLGFVVIYGIFLWLYVHALRHKVPLEMTELEVFDTRSKIYSQVIMMGFGLLSISLALVLPNSLTGLSGILYTLIGPVSWIYYARRAKLRKRQ